MIPPILQQRRGADREGRRRGRSSLRVLLTLLPQALELTIPMALLLGILVGFGRLSADREFVALQACGVSLFRAAPADRAARGRWRRAATAYEMIVALPDANQTFREITFNVVAVERGERRQAARVLRGLPEPRDLRARHASRRRLARRVPRRRHAARIRRRCTSRSEGRLLDRSREADGAAACSRTAPRTPPTPSKPDEYDGSAFERLVLEHGRRDRLPAHAVVEGRQRDDDRRAARRPSPRTRANDAPAYSQRFTIQQKFSLPVACLVLALIGLALGASNRKDGKLASFALGIGVIFVYYVLLYSSRAAALGGRLPPGFAPWLVNIVLGVAGVALVIWRARLGRSADSLQPAGVLARRRRRGRRPRAGDAPRRRRAAASWSSSGFRTSTGRGPRLLDLVRRRGSTCRSSCSAFVALVGIFYISTFIDLADKLFGGVAPTAACCSAISISRRRSSSTTSSRWRRWSRRWSRSAC